MSAYVRLITLSYLTRGLFYSNRKREYRTLEKIYVIVHTIFDLISGEIWRDLIILVVCNWITLQDYSPNSTNFREYFPIIPMLT